MPPRSTDWLAALDLGLAASNVETDVRGDWYKDPWGWPEIRWAIDRSPESLIGRLSRGGACRATPIDVPKENFALRPAMVLDPIDRLCFQALVDRLSPDLIGAQPVWAYGWRLPPGEIERGRYARNDYQWNNFRDQLSGLAGLFDAGLKTDVVSFFASVDLDRVSDMIDDRTGGGAPQARVMELLAGWDGIPSRSGLPQRSMASAVLANAFLRPVDDLMREFGAADTIWRHIGMTPHGAACRWMDDVWLFGNDASELRRAQLDLQRALEAIGLRMNFAKTDVLEGEALKKEVLELEHSAVDEGLAQSERDTAPLDELIDTLVESPEHASRTSLRFACSRMRENVVFGRVDAFVAHAGRMPHGADHLARLFRDSEAWRDLPEWYVDHCRSQWNLIDWSSAQLGMMFPASSAPERVADHFAEALSGQASGLVTTSIAAQRLSVWNPDQARSVIREAGRDSSSPVVRRLLALAALQAGEPRFLVRSLLTEFEENAVTLALLEDRNFQPLAAVGDFAQ